MLFRALVDRIFGTNDRPNGNEAPNQSTSLRLPYDKYPTLAPLLVRLLGGRSLVHSSKQQHDIDLSASVPAELVFPALDILRRAGRPNHEDTTIDRLVFIHLGSKIWNIRELAARTFCSLASETQYISILAELLKPYHRTSNRWHGVLLTMKFLVEMHFRCEGIKWQSVLGISDYGAYLTMRRGPHINHIYPVTTPHRSCPSQVSVRPGCIC